MLKFDITPWFIGPLANFINKGEIVEAFVAQELLAYSDPIRKEALFYWSKEERASTAEVDYLIQLQQQVVPIEVKSGINKRIKSMHIFLGSHPNSTYALRFWPGTGSINAAIHTYPLYAIVAPLINHNSVMKTAMLSLL